MGTQNALNMGWKEVIGIILTIFLAAMLALASSKESASEHKADVCSLQKQIDLQQTEIRDTRRSISNIEKDVSEIKGMLKEKGGK